MIIVASLLMFTSIGMVTLGKLGKECYTCKGRYVAIFLYHIRLLLHFSDRREIFFPFFIRRSLYKVVQGI